MRHFVKIEPTEYLRYGPWLGAPRRQEFFTSPRVIVRQILKNNRPRIVCAYTNDTIYYTQIAFAIIPKKQKKSSSNDIQFLSAILSSSTIDYYHEKKFLDPEKVVFPKALIANFKQLPIPPAGEADKARLSELERACAIAAKKNDAASLATLESEINQIVYRLFALTPAEIAIVEGTAP
jgi:hypothetical protein